MSDAECILIALRRRDGSIRAHAIIDACDAQMTAYRWCLDRGYAKRTLPRSGGKQGKVYLHRQIMGLTPSDGVEIDHIDRDRLNCRRSNLRIVTHAQNTQNVPARPDSSSPYRGVSWDAANCKWRAQAALNGVNCQLGRFNDEHEAAAVVQAWRLANMPFAARLDAIDAAKPIERRRGVAA